MPIILGLSTCNTETIQLTKDCTYCYSVGHMLASTALERRWAHMKPLGVITGKTAILSFTALKTSRFHSSNDHLLWKVQREGVCPLHYTQLGVFVNWIDISIILDLHSSLCLFILSLMMNFFRYYQYFFLWEWNCKISLLQIIVKKCMLCWHLPYSTKMNKKNLCRCEYIMLKKGWF